MKTDSTNTVKYPRKLGGEKVIASATATVAIPYSAYRRCCLSLACAASSAGVCTTAGSTTTAAGFGAAETCTGGGGHSVSPSAVTVIDRWTMSSMSSSSRPSLPGVSSLSRFTMLVPYSCEVCAGIRLVRSV